MRSRVSRIGVISPLKARVYGGVYGGVVYPPKDWARDLWARIFMQYVHDSASELTYSMLCSLRWDGCPCKPKHYELTYNVGGEVFRMLPPPSYLSKKFIERLKKLAGLKPGAKKEQIGYLRLRVRKKDRAFANNRKSCTFEVLNFYDKKGREGVVIHDIKGLEGAVADSEL